jgi:alpha-N-arabinofuranosidase
MKRVDPSIELVACGSSKADMPTFAAWEATVLEQTYDHVDYLSLHSYYDPESQDEASFRAAAVNLDGYISDIVATADHVRAKLRRSKRIKLALDEWNVWYQSRFTEPEDRPIEDTPALIEDTYTVTDAMVVGNLLISMLRHAGRVTVGAQAQLVNVIAPIRTTPGGAAWRQTIFHPFAQTARLARGTVLHVGVQSPVMSTGRYGEVPSVDAVATYDEQRGRLVVFVVNRSTAAVPLELDLRAFPGLGAAQRISLAEDDPSIGNTADAPDRVCPRTEKMPALDGGRAAVLLPPVSWHALSFTPEEKP